jgi:hypothetical protein
MAGELRERSPEPLRAREHRIELNATLRAAFLAGAEEQALADQGRGLTGDELLAVMAEDPGDLPTR